MGNISIRLPNTQHYDIVKLDMLRKPIITLSMLEHWTLDEIRKFYEKFKALAMGIEHKYVSKRTFFEILGGKESMSNYIFETYDFKNKIAFRLFDFDNNEQVSEDEHRFIFVSTIKGIAALNRGKIPTTDVIRLIAHKAFDLADINKDKVLDFPELVAWVESNRPFKQFLENYEPVVKIHEDTELYENFPTINIVDFSRKVLHTYINLDHARKQTFSYLLKQSMEALEDLKTSQVQEKRGKVCVTARTLAPLTYVKEKSNSKKNVEIKRLLSRLRFLDYLKRRGVRKSPLNCDYFRKVIPPRTFSLSQIDKNQFNFEDNPLRRCDLTKQARTGGRLGIAMGERNSRNSMPTTPTRTTQKNSQRVFTSPRPTLRNYLYTESSSMPNSSSPSPRKETSKVQTPTPVALVDPLEERAPFSTSPIHSQRVPKTPNKHLIMKVTRRINSDLMGRGILRSRANEGVDKNFTFNSNVKIQVEDLARQKRKFVITPQKAVRGLKIIEQKFSHVIVYKHRGHAE